MTNVSIPKQILASLTTLASEAKEIAKDALQLQKEVEEERLREAKRSVDQL